MGWLMSKNSAKYVLCLKVSVNFYRYKYKTFAVFKSVTVEFFFESMNKHLKPGKYKVGSVDPS